MSDSTRMKSSRRPATTSHNNISTDDKLDEESKRLKSKYSSTLSTLRELFPDWKDEDLLTVLSETEGDIEAAVTRIAEGHASQWGEVKKKKDKTEKVAEKPKKQAEHSNGIISTNPPANVSGKHGTKPLRGGKTERGGRSRGPKRVNGVPVASNNSATTTTATTATTTATTATTTATTNTTNSVPTPQISSGSKSWADTLSKKPTAAPAAKITPSSALAPESAPAPVPAPVPVSALVPEPVPAETQPEESSTTNEPSASSSSIPSQKLSWAAVAAPSKPVKKVAPATTTTAALEPVEQATIETGVQPTAEETVIEQPTVEPQQPIVQLEQSIRPPGLYDNATSKLLTQEVPVILPGSVDRINRVGVQFGSLNLDEDSKAEEITEEPASISQPQHQQSQQPQQPHQYRQYQNYNRYQQHAGQPQQKAEGFSQTQYGYPGSHPAYNTGYDYHQTPYANTNEHQRSSYPNYYSPYQQQQHGQEGFNREQPQQPQPQQQQPLQQQSQQSQRFDGSSNASATQSPAANTVSPGAPHGAPYQQPAMNPYYMSPQYAAYYYQTYGYSPQVAAAAAAQYGNAGANGPQKNYYNQQQSYYGSLMDHYRPQGQQQVPQAQPNGSQQPQQPQQQQAQQQQQQQQPAGSSLSGISDFLQRDDSKGQSVQQGGAGSPQNAQAQVNQPHPGQQQQGHPGYPVQQSLYSYGGTYGQYGQGQAQGRQGWGYGQ